jgi:hypothetical protein
MGIFGVFPKEEKIHFLISMSEENHLMFSPIKNHPELFNLDEIYRESDKEIQKFEEEIRSFESGNRPPKFLWESDNSIKFIKKGSIKTRKEAEAFLESIRSNKDDVLKPK